jgi:glycosyltransferase involved in cell wall biosynthesis
MRCPTLAELPPPPPGKSGWPWTIETPPLPRLQSNGVAWPRISIVTPSYNQGEFIEETIRSVLLQGYPDLEYLVVDGGSTDASVVIIEKYAPWLAYWVSEADGGQSCAINKGLSKITGEYCNWLNSDDILNNNCLALIAKAGTSEPDVDIISGARILKHVDTGYESIEDLYWKYYLAGLGNFPQDATFFSRHLFNLAGPIDERLRFGLDTAYYYTAMRFARKIILVRALLSEMKIYAGQKTARDDPYKKEVEAAILRQNLRPESVLVAHLLRSKLHVPIRELLPLVFWKRRRKFKVMQLDVSSSQWRFTQA